MCLSTNRDNIIQQQQNCFDEDDESQPQHFTRQRNYIPFKKMFENLSLSLSLIVCLSTNRDNVFTFTFSQYNNKIVLRWRWRITTTTLRNNTTIYLFQKIFFGKSHFSPFTHSQLVRKAIEWWEKMKKMNETNETLNFIRRRWWWWWKEWWWWDVLLLDYRGCSSISEEWDFQKKIF